MSVINSLVALRFFEPLTNELDDFLHPPGDGVGVGHVVVQSLGVEVGLEVVEVVPHVLVVLREVLDHGRVFGNLVLAEHEREVVVRVPDVEGVHDQVQVEDLGPPDTWLLPRQETFVQVVQHARVVQETLGEASKASLEVVLEVVDEVVDSVHDLQSLRPGLGPLADRVQVPVSRVYVQYFSIFLLLDTRSIFYTHVAHRRVITDHGHEQQAKAKVLVVQVVCDALDQGLRVGLDVVDAFLPEPEVPMFPEASLDDRPAVEPERKQGFFEQFPFFEVPVVDHDVLELGDLARQHLGLLVPDRVHEKGKRRVWLVSLLVDDLDHVILEIRVASFS